MADAGTTFLDLWYANMAECKMEKIGDDIKHWCLNDEDTCFRLGGVLERVWDNFFPMLHNLVDIVEIAKTNDICYDDEALIGEWAQAYGDVCKNAVIVHGMQPLTWNEGLA